MLTMDLSRRMLQAVDGPPVDILDFRPLAPDSCVGSGEKAKLGGFCAGVGLDKSKGLR